MNWQPWIRRVGRVGRRFKVKSPCFSESMDLLGTKTGLSFPWNKIDVGRRHVACDKRRADDGTLNFCEASLGLST